MGKYNNMSWVLAFVGFMLLGGICKANGAIYNYDFVVSASLRYTSTSLRASCMFMVIVACFSLGCMYRCMVWIHTDTHIYICMRFPTLH